MSHFSTKFCENRSSYFLHNPANEQTKADENITSLAVVNVAGATVQTQFERR